MCKRQPLALLLLLITTFLFAQDKVKIDYNLSPREYEIADIKVTGAESYENSVIIGFSELSVGQKIKVPGDDITKVVKRFWKQGMFSDVKVTADKIQDGKIWLHIDVKQQPKISEIRFNGCKKSHIDDLEAGIGLSKGGQFTRNLENQTKMVVLKYYEDKGYYGAEVNIIADKDVSQLNSVIVTIDVKKNEKVRVNKITFEGNKDLSRRKLNRAMKKTNEKGRLINLFSSTKFVRPLYEEDKTFIIDKYNEKGYRDAAIEFDTVVPTPSYKIKCKRSPNFTFKKYLKSTFDKQVRREIYIYDTVETKYSKKLVDVYLKINEGKKYYFRNINWVGNTIYSSDFLSQNLRIKKGDVYNSKLITDRLTTDEDAVGNLYQDNGYLFSNIDPVEAKVEGDSIDLEMRVYEGRQAVINKIGISGNTRVYEHVVRRELRTKPGQLYSKSDIMRTLREVAQMGHFDPEKLQPDILPNQENGTVDINYKLETKSSDQIELSAGYGATGVTGSLGLKFTNFAIQNIFKPETYKIVPQGEGQTLSLKATTNGSYYTSFSASFLDPWFGKKRPNSLSVSAYFSMQSGISDRYSSVYDNTSYYSQMYGNTYAYEVDPEQYLHTFGASIGWGTRLTWPDDYFMFNVDLNYQLYSLKNWKYFIMKDGKSNNINLGLTLSRNSIDNPIYTRSGSSVALSVESTLPYSLMFDRDYSSARTSSDSDAVKYQWLEYHKWKLKTKFFTPLSKNQKLVLMTRVEYGFLGYFNKNYRSPFQTFYMGGDGMSGSYTSYATDIVALRGYSNGALTPYSSTIGGYSGNLYTRLSLELRFPIVLETSTTIYALAFAEGGNCWSEFSEFNPFDLKRSAGIGVRLFLPMFGLMGVDWGYGFDTVKNTPSYSGSHFNFIIGQEF